MQTVAVLNSEGGIFNMGTLSPTPWDLSLCGKNGRLAPTRLDLVRLPLVGAGHAGNSVGRRASPPPPFPQLSRRSGSR
jgi:hypothetical protein